MGAVGYVLVGGLVAGTFDIAYACGYWAWRAGTAPSRILQSVAAGLLGPPSFQGGARTAALGLGLHFFIAISMSITYWLVATRWPLLREKAVVCGLLYGVLLYLIMNYVVIPLSAATPRPSTDQLWVVLSVLVHAFLIGLPIALFTRRALTP